MFYKGFDLRVEEVDEVYYELSVYNIDNDEIVYQEYINKKDFDYERVDSKLKRIADKYVNQPEREM